MNTNINKHLEEAVSRRTGWTEARVRSTLAHLAAQSTGSSVDWEPGDEEWARVVGSDGSVLALVCARFPFVFVPAGAMATHPLEGVTWISVPSMDASVFSVDPTTLEQAFGRAVSQQLDYEAVSAHDIWWATVS